MRQCEYCGEILRKRTACCDTELLDAGTAYDIDWWAPIIDDPEIFGGGADEDD